MYVHLEFYDTIHLKMKQYHDKTITPQMTKTIAFFKKNMFINFQLYKSHFMQLSDHFFIRFEFLWLHDVQNLT